MIRSGRWRVRLRLSVMSRPEHQGRQPIELFGRTRFPPFGGLPYLLTLAPCGFYWFQLEDPQQAHSR